MKVGQRLRRWLCGTLSVISLVLSGNAWATPEAPERGSTSPLIACRQPGLPNEVQCGQLQRPLNPLDPQSPAITVHYVVLPALTRHKQADPLFILAGGPGQSAIDLAPTLAGLYRRLNQQRDIVLVDQRGTGRSAPLVCKEPGRQALASQALATQVKQVLQCRDELAQQAPWRTLDGLRWFTTTLAVQDMDAVRQQLGAPQVNLIGASYGTRVALEWLRLFPRTVRRAVLDGVAPPDMVLPESSGPDGEAAFEALLNSCEADAACTQRHPTLRDSWERLWRSVPRTISANHPQDGRRETFLLTPDLLAAWVRGPLYVPSLASALPAALSAAGQDRWEGLLGLNAVLSAQQSNGGGVALGMHFAVVCAEDPPRITRSSPAGWNDSARQLYAQVCAQWPRGHVPSDFTQIPTSPARVLLLSGGIDPITPPRHGERVAQALGPLARHLVVPGAGHGLMGVGCLSQVITQFIRSTDSVAALAVDTRCALDIPRPPMFELPGALP